MAEPIPADYRKPGDIIDLPRGKLTRQADAVRYRYTESKTQCPGCGGLGVPWAGWFSCEQSCGGVALVDTGEFFMPTDQPQPDPR